MKALTDKIIDCLKDRCDHFIGSQKNNETQAENRGFKQGLQWAIGTVESLESSAEFEEIARVMMKYIAKNHNPHSSAVIDSIHAQLSYGEKAVETTEYLID